MLQIRACDPAFPDSDLTALAGACADGAEGLETPGEKAIARMRAAQQAHPDALALAFRGDTPAGMCAVGLPGDGGSAVLRFLGVLPAYRRCGIGRALEAHAAALARGCGCAALRTGEAVNSRNRAGAGFLTALGWRPLFGAGIRMWRGLEDLPPVELPPTYTIRTYRPGDQAAFVQIKNRVFVGAVAAGRDWTVADFQRGFLDSPHFHPERIFFAIHNGEPVGTASAWATAHEGREVGLMHWVAVMPEHRGRGLGKALNVRALHRLAELGYREAVLNTGERREAAVRLYYSLGFRDYCRRAVYEKRLNV